MSEPDFCSLPRDGQNAEEHLCDDPSSFLGTLPFDSAQGGTGHRVLCGERRRAKAAGGEPWAFIGPKASIDRFERGQDG